MNDTNSLSVSFGTSGHRGIIGQDFCPSHVAAIAVGIASLFQNSHKPARLIIGFDPREGNDIACSSTSSTGTLISHLNALGIHTVSYSDYIPTPVISWLISHENFDGGIILTASHNPPNYNGIKFNPKNGAPAPKDITEHIETQANAFLKNPFELSCQTPGTHEQLPAPFKAFGKALKENLEELGIPLPTFTKSLLIDVKHGACGAVWKSISETLNMPIELQHSEPRADFGNIEPNPTKYEHLPTPSKAHYFTAANDPDGDRHAILDPNGHPLTPEELTVILIDYLLSKQKKPQSIATTLASSHRIQAACTQHNIAYHETAVGFKYIAPHLEIAKQNNEICLGVESSGGFSSSTHTLEKCGFFPVIALAAILEHRQTSLTQLKDQLNTTYGTYIFNESELRFNASQKKHLQTFLENATHETLSPLFDTPIETINKTDGLKITFKDQTWSLCRLSGTEPVLRVYTEASTQKSAQALNVTTKTTIETFSNQL